MGDQVCVCVKRSHNCVGGNYILLASLSKQNRERVHVVICDFIIDVCHGRKAGQVQVRYLEYITKRPSENARIGDGTLEEDLKFRTQH